MGLTIKVVVASLLLGGCSASKHTEVICDFTDQRSHVCPKEGHGPCPFCPVKLTADDYPVSLSNYDQDDIERKAHALGIRTVDYLHLVNNQHRY